jgi:ATP:ADP antiporter, AAA family
MKKFLLKALDIESEELGPVSLLLAISFFIGIFIVTYDVGTSTLFLDNKIWGQTHLSEAFILSGVLGVMASYIFVSLQKRIPFFTLVVITFSLIFFYVVALSVVMEITHNKHLIYVAFASLGVLNALALLSFYGIVTRSFNLKNQKRLTGTVDQGQMFATAIAFFAVPFIQELPIFTDVIHFLFVSFIGIGLSLVLLLFFVKNFGTTELLQLKNFRPVLRR